MRLLAPALIVGTLILGAAAAVAAPRIAAPVAGAASARTTILTGQWEYNTRFGPIPIDSDMHCLTDKDVENFNQGICLKRYTCDYETREVRDGKIALKGTWTDKKGRVAPVTAKGSYTPESFTIAVNGKTVGGMPMAATLEAKRVSATCPAS
ncbi:DUF3617 domain-containing protein [Caulobacter soli]|uniref:DUF3617 domain-containing protein n=1 Tax=Caulobacter soli TaxID=2708539 RepID=UPI0013EBFB88|nr:DUF3617 family protein [Caulobacter soli]